MTAQRDGLLDKIRALLAKTLDNGCTCSLPLHDSAAAKAGVKPTSASWCSAGCHQTYDSRRGCSIH
jgi:hypothetical protein